MKKVLILLFLVPALLLCGCNDADSPAPSQSPTVESVPVPEENQHVGNDISLLSIDRYAGAFVEDGTDEIVSDIMAITVRNDGGKTVQYAHIVVTIDGKAYEFDLSTLPVGAKAQVLELNRAAMPASVEGFLCDVSVCAFFDEEPSMHGELFEIGTADTAITVTNVSDSDLSGIYVYYKISYGELYMGGITYRVGVESLKAGESYTCYAGHFSEKYSSLMFVSYAE